MRKTGYLNLLFYRGRQRKTDIWHILPFPHVHFSHEHCHYQYLYSCTCFCDNNTDRMKRCQYCCSNHSLALFSLWRKSEALGAFDILILPRLVSSFSFLFVCSVFFPYKLEVFSTILIIRIFFLCQK